MFYLRVAAKLRAAPTLAFFTEILLEAFQEDGDRGAPEAQVETDNNGTFWSDWTPLHQLLTSSGASFAVNPYTQHAATNGWTGRSPRHETDLWFQIATRYELDLSKPPFLLPLNDAR